MCTGQKRKKLKSVVTEVSTTRGEVSQKKKCVSKKKTYDTCSNLNGPNLLTAKGNTNICEKSKETPAMM